MDVSILAADEHLVRRLEAMLDEAVASGEYLEVTTRDFDEMEREAQGILRKRASS